MRCEVFKEKGTSRTIELVVTKDGEVGFCIDEDVIDSEAKCCYLNIDQTERLIEWLIDAIEEVEDENGI